MINPSFKIKEENLTDTYGEFIIGPLETGYGYTLAHTLKRMLLMSIPGAAITSVKINGVKHKFTQFPGLKENIVEFLLNLKGLSVKLPKGSESATLRLEVKGPKEITGKEVSGDAEIVNPDHYLGFLSDKKLEMEMTVEEGYGYSLSENKTASELGVIQTDAIYTPVNRVNYTVSSTRVGRRTDLDEIKLQIWTNGSISPKDALMETAKILATYFTQIYEPKQVISSETVSSKPSVNNDLMKLTIDELDLPTRIYNSLRNGGIETVGGLLETPKKDLMSLRNMGTKSLSIIEAKLNEKGISLNI